MSGHDQTPDDRLGLEAFDQVDPPDQWTEIVERAQGPPAMAVGAAAAGNGRIWTRVAMLAAAAVLIVVAAVAIAVRSDEGTAPATLPPDTLAPPDTVRPSSTVTSVAGPDTTTDPAATPTVAPPSTDAATPESTTTLALPSLGPGSTLWSPPCTDVAGNATASHPPRFDTFTTFASEPTLDLEVPVVPSSAGSRSPYLTPVQVAGGIVVALRETADGDDGSVDVTSVVAVDLDGSIRWRRCLDGAGYMVDLLVGPDGDRGAVWAAFVEPGGDALRLAGFDLASGADVESGTPVRRLVTSDGRRAVLGLPSDASPVTADDVLVVFDAADGTSTEIPYPGVALAKAPTDVGLALVELDDGFAVTAHTVSNDAIEMFVDGAWTDDPAQLRRLPPRLDLFSGEGLSLVDGAGDVVWTAPDFRPIQREGFHSAIAESVVVAVDCPDASNELGCRWGDDGAPPDERLVGFDIESGAELWSRPSGVAFAAIAGDRGIVTADRDGDGSWDRWELIDLRTGQRVDDQSVTEWPGQGWTNACCGEGDYAWTLLDGGLLFESTGWSLRVWLPPDVSSPTTAVALHG